MRPIVVGILFCFALAAGAVCANRFAGTHLDLSAPFAASSAAIIALIFAAMPLRLVRNAPAATVMQTGLLATIIHMSILLICAAVVLLGRMPVGSSFIYWLMAVYVVTMAAVVAAVTSAIRQSTPTATKA